MKLLAWIDHLWGSLRLIWMSSEDPFFSLIFREMIFLKQIDPKLLKEMIGSTNQLLFYKQNQPKKPIPEKLEGRIAYIRAYYRAIKRLEKMKRDGTLEGINFANYDKRIEASFPDYEDPTNGGV